MLERLEAERADADPEPRDRRAMRVRFPEAPRSGERVLRLAGIAKSYGETVVYRALDLEVVRGERIALVGPNGAGKSTLLRLAADVLPAEAGLREPGHNVRVGFYAQHALQALDPDQTVLGEIGRTAALDQVPQLRGLLGAFLFSGDDVEKRVSVLSGGEKARLALAKLLLARPNFLVLDEPTNHLDIRAQDVLIDALQRFGGTQLFISHDRTFINALATRILEVTPGPDGACVRSFPGNYDDYARKLDAEEASLEAPGGSAKPTAPRRRRAKPTFTLRRLQGRAGELERDIEASEAELERIGWLAADPAVARDGERMRALAGERQTLEAKLAVLYSDWERTSTEIEAVENRNRD
jgi:ATP-binding cassette subfamily F protein 3